MNAEEKPVVVERYADNGDFSHYALIRPSNGELLWSEAPEEEMHATLQSQPKQLSDEEVKGVLKMYSKGQPVVGDGMLYYREDYVLDAMKACRTGGGVDLDANDIAEVIVREQSKEGTSALSMAQEIVDYLTNRNKQDNQ